MRGGKGGRIHRGHGDVGGQEEGLGPLPGLLHLGTGAVLPGPVQEGQEGAQEEQAAQLQQEPGLQGCHAECSVVVSLVQSETVLSVYIEAVHTCSLSLLTCSTDCSPQVLSSLLESATTNINYRNSGTVRFAVFGLF